MTVDEAIKYCEEVAGINKGIAEQIIKKSMTYGMIYDEFCKKFPNAEVSDYRPAIPMYMPQLSKGIPNAIIVWLKDGSKMVYIAEEAKDD